MNRRSFFCFLAALPFVGRLARTTTRESGNVRDANYERFKRIRAEMWSRDCGVQLTEANWWYWPLEHRPDSFDSLGPLIDESHKHHSHFAALLDKHRSG